VLSFKFYRITYSPPLGALTKHTAPFGFPPPLRLLHVLTPPHGHRHRHRSSSHLLHGCPTRQDRRRLPPGVHHVRWRRRPLLSHVAVWSLLCPAARTSSGTTPRRRPIHHAQSATVTCVCIHIEVGSVTHHFSARQAAAGGMLGGSQPSLREWDWTATTVLPPVPHHTSYAFGVSYVEEEQNPTWPHMHRIEYYKLNRRKDDQ
jgi:hypothetical protein